MLVGEGAAGKTSLVKALCKESFDKKESQTHGIRIKKQDRQIGVDNVKLHFWDFGGQEIMHATHQFFLSKRSIYLLVLDSRRDEKAEYWLKHIESFGGKSPIIVVLNKMDENPGFRVNEQFLQARYPNIKGFYKVSCNKKTGIEELRKALEREINGLELRKTMFPKPWFAVKNEFDHSKQDFITEDHYRNICIKHQVEDERDQDILLRLLNDLGKVLHYDALRLHNTEVLNPHWLTNGVYRIINSPIIAAQKGWFEENELEAIIEDERYQKSNPNLLSNLKEFFSKSGKVENYRFPRDKYAFLIGMMQEFELCFQLPGQQRGYIIPELLQVEEQQYPFSSGSTVLHFIFEYPDFLPTSIFPRLMVRLHDYLHEDRKWRTGMCLSGGMVFEAIANIISDKEAKRLHINITGKDARRFLALIRQTIRSINLGFQKLNWVELVPLPDQDKMGKETFVKYEELIGLEEMGVMDYVNGELKKKYRVQDLLNGVEESRQDTVNPIRLFVSYSKHDQLHKDNFIKHLSGLRKENILTWHDNDLLPGEEWDDRIKTELLKADIVLYLVSHNSMATEYIQNVELRLIEQRVKRKECVLVPVIVDFCHWTDLDFAQHNALPEKDIPVTNTKHWVNEHEAWLFVMKGVKRLIEVYRQQ